MKNLILSFAIFCLTNTIASAQSPCQIRLISAGGTTAQTVHANTVITAVTYSVSGTSASASGLPNGVTGGYNANVFTISGMPTVSGTFNYTITTTGGCNPDANMTGTIRVTSPY